MEACHAAHGTTPPRLPGPPAPPHRSPPATFPPWSRCHTTSVTTHLPAPPAERPVQLGAPGRSQPAFHACITCRPTYPAMCAPGVQRHLHHPAHDQGHARPDQELDPRAHHAHERSLRPVRRCTRAAFHCLPACTFQSARLSWMPEEHSRPTAHSAGTASSAQETARRTVGRCGTGASWAFTR